MTETRCLKNVVIFIQTILSFVLSRKIINEYIRERHDGSIQRVRKLFVLAYDRETTTLQKIVTENISFQE